MSQPPEAADPVRYVVVVHGIGEQRKNETVISVVGRFAEARRESKKASSVDILTLGMASGQTGKECHPGECQMPAPSSASRPWLEFEGIPQRPPPSPGALPPFLGQRSDSGENLRFTDLWWADVMQEDIQEIGQRVDVWADGLLGRLRRRGRPVPIWITENLETLRQTFILARNVMGLYAKDAEELVFTKFLGDLQLYGEYAHCRGRAIRKFHDLMARIEEWHAREQQERRSHGRAELGEARYTIIAHSLGTVMSMEALLYAHVTAGTRKDGAAGVANLPFEGYQKVRAEENLPATTWIDRVDSLVTLGSPIDKYLVVWWLNYGYMLDPDKWLDATASWATTGARGEIERRRKILHFNYAEEQDPVGHQLDVARTTPTYRRVFENREDRVYNRDPYPLVAHIGYWKDLELFQLILHKAVDHHLLKSCDKCPVLEWFSPAMHRRVVRYTYKLVPYLVIALDSLAFTWAYYSKSWHAAAIASVAFVVTCLIGRKLLDLSVWWRQIQKIKAEPTCEAEEKPLREKDPQQFTTWAWVAAYLRPSTAGVKNRKVMTYRFQTWLWTWCLLWMTAAGLVVGVCLVRWPLQTGWGRLLFIGLTAVATLSFLRWLLKTEETARPRDSVWAIDGILIVAVLVFLGSGTGIAYLSLVTNHGNEMIDSSVIPAAAAPFERVAPGSFARIRPYIHDVLFCAGAFSLVAAIVFAYVLVRYFSVRRILRKEGIEAIDFATYASG